MKKEEYTLHIQSLIYTLSSNALLFYVSVVMMFSYFYNLPLLSYGFESSYELRIYDVCGIFFLYFHIVNKPIISYIIHNIMPNRWFWYFFKWASITLLLTLYFSIYFSKILSFIQTLLYLYHLYIFFISSVFIYLICLQKNKLETYIKIICVFSILTSLIVIIQNFGMIPFLWNDSYKQSYQEFLSGTLGPNKIVLGMTSLFMFIFSLSVYIEKKMKVNSILVLLTLLLSFYALIISGSRTSYVGLLIFLSYFAFNNFGRFIYLSVVFFSISFCVILINGDLYNKVEKVINGRVINKVKNKDALSKAKVGQLYEDLGAGRKELSEQNALFLIENPIVIPFGLGFNNKLISVYGSSAHNMYIQVIKELGIVGFILYFGWLIQYLFVTFEEKKGFSTGLKGLVIAMLVTAYFGEQLYIYRALFGLLGLFFLITSLFFSILHKEHFRK